MWQEHVKVKVQVVAALTCSLAFCEEAKARTGCDKDGQQSTFFSLKNPPFKFEI